MIGGLLRQAVINISLATTLSHDVIKELQERMRKKSPLDLEETLTFLAKILKQFSKSYICIDALDECTTDSDRRSLLESLGMLSKEITAMGHSTRIFITGRLHVANHVQRYITTASESASSYTSIKLEANPSDISKFVIDAIAKDTSDVPMDPTFREEIVSEIIASSHGMFVIQPP
jgi:uncharacterized protein YfeS